MRGFGRGRGRGRGGGRGRGRGGVSQVPTKDELDAQLDAYNAKVNLCYSADKCCEFIWFIRQTIFSRERKWRCFELL